MPIPVTPVPVRALLTTRSCWPLVEPTKTVDAFVLFAVPRLNTLPIPVPASAAVETTVKPATIAPKATPFKNGVFIRNPSVSAPRMGCHLPRDTTDPDNRFTTCVIECHRRAIAAPPAAAPRLPALALLCHRDGAHITTDVDVPHAASKRR